MPHTATLTKDRARKPLAEGANAIGSQTCDREGKPVYRLTLYQRFVDGKSNGYEVTIDRTTMLEVVASWIAGEANTARLDDKKKAKEQT